MQIVNIEQEMLQIFWMTWEMSNLQFQAFHKK